MDKCTISPNAATQASKQYPVFVEARSRRQALRTLNPTHEYLQNTTVHTLPQALWSPNWSTDPTQWSLNSKDKNQAN